MRGRVIVINSCTYYLIKDAYKIALNYDETLKVSWEKIVCNIILSECLNNQVPLFSHGYFNLYKFCLLFNLNVLLLTFYFDIISRNST